MEIMSFCWQLLHSGDKGIKRSKTPLQLSKLTTDNLFDYP